MGSSLSLPCRGWDGGRRNQSVPRVELSQLLAPTGFLWWRRRRRRKPVKQLSDNPDTFGRKLSDNLHEREWRGGAGGHAGGSTPVGGGTALQPEAPHQDAQAPCRICAVCRAVETAWHRGGNGGSKGAGQPDGSSGATAGTTSTPDTAMVLHGSGSGGGGPATPGTSGSGPIPELPFASALLTSSDYKVDVGEPSLGLECVVWQASLFIAVFIAFRRQPLHAACMKGHAQSKLLPHKRVAIPSSRSRRCAPAVPSLLCRPLQRQAGAAGLRTLCQRVPRSVRRRAGGHQGGSEDESASA